MLGGVRGTILYYKAQKWGPYRALHANLTPPILFTNVMILIIDQEICLDIFTSNAISILVYKKIKLQAISKPIHLNLIKSYAQTVHYQRKTK